jgi:hypothetical protein
MFTHTHNQKVAAITPQLQVVAVCGDYQTPIHQGFAVDLGPFRIVARP